MKVQRYKKVMSILCFAISIFSVICYRGFIIKDYASQWVDEDQALLWYGTSLAARFGIAEPHFLGQAYGSMLESIIAVPLYWLRVPLNYALPIATFILWFAPFMFCSLKIWSRNRFFPTIVILSAMLCHWDYDIIVGMPRSFISGFSFSFIGIILLIESNERAKWKAFIAPILLALAYINTETSITIIGLGILYYLLYCVKNLRSTWCPFILGSFCGILLILFCNKFFYVLNPEYILHGGANSISFSKDVLIRNLSNFKNLACSFSAYNIAGIPIFLIVTIVFLFLLTIAYKQWKLMLVYICASVGSILFLAHPKSLDYYDALLFSQTRMFLFVPYIILLLLFFLGMNMAVDSNFTKFLQKVNIPITCIGVLIAITKTVYFENVVINKEELYTSAVIRVINVQEVYKAAEEIKEYAGEKNCEVVVMLTDNRTIGYCTGAINYSEYISYNAFYDRRSATYFYLKNRLIDQKVLFVHYKNGAVSNMVHEQVTGNLIDYIRENKGIQRYPEGHKYYIESVTATQQEGVN